jgi:hypothetical protein
MFSYNAIKGIGGEEILSVPLIMRVDNTDAIYHANNHSATPRTQHTMWKKYLFPLM